MAVYTEMDFGSILSDAELDSDVDNSDFDLNGGASSWIPKVSGVLSNLVVNALHVVYLLRLSEGGLKPLLTYLLMMILFCIV